jgi:hypothetical protein
VVERRLTPKIKELEQQIQQFNSNRETDAKPSNDQMEDDDDTVNDPITMLNTNYNKYPIYFLDSSVIEQLQRNLGEIDLLLDVEDNKPTTTQSNIELLGNKVSELEAVR